MGREPSCSFEIAVRGLDGDPRVIKNAPFFHDGTPMPTLYWLVSPRLCKAVSRIETRGGVRLAESEVDSDKLAQAHERYRAGRDELISDDWSGPRPAGGVGGTRRGVKCLHAHYAWFLAGGDDPVGQWVHERLSNGDLS